MPRWVKWIGGFLLVGVLMQGGDNHLRRALVVGLAMALSLGMIWVVMIPLVSLVEYWVPDGYVKVAGTMARGVRLTLCGLCLLGWLMWLIPAP